MVDRGELPREVEKTVLRYDGEAQEWTGVVGGWDYGMLMLIRMNFNEKNMVISW